MRVLGSLGLLTLVAPALLLGIAPITEAGDRVGFVLASDSHRTHYRDHGGHHGSHHRNGLSVFLDLGHLRIFGGHRRPHHEARLHRGQRGGRHIERGQLAHKRSHLVRRAERELGAGHFDRAHGLFHRAEHVEEHRQLRHGHARAGRRYTRNTNHRNSYRRHHRGH